MTQRIRVLLVDDHPLVIDGIQARLENEGTIEVVGRGGNGQEAITLCKALQPDVVLMDISMPIMNGLEATRILSRDAPEIRVLILSMHDNREYMVQLIQAGAKGYILKDVSAAEMVKAVETVYHGGTYFSASASQTLFSHFEQSGNETTESPLTQRELTVLTLLAEGHNNKEIARVLGISVRTVETHRQNIKAKLDIHTAAGLTRYAIEHALVQLS
jgi:two-component system nitrate/nitrite response regulator NarL